MKRPVSMFLTVSLLSVAACKGQRAEESQTPEPATQADMQMGMQRMDMAQSLEMQSRMMADSAIMQRMMGDSAMRSVMQEMRGDAMPMTHGAMGGMDASGRQQMMARMQERMDSMTPEQRQAMMVRMRDSHMRMMADPDVRARMMGDPDMRRMMQQRMRGGMRDTSLFDER